MRSAARGTAKRGKPQVRKRPGSKQPINSPPVPHLSRAGGFSSRRSSFGQVGRMARRWIKFDFPTMTSRPFPHRTRARECGRFQVGAPSGSLVLVIAYGHPWK
jgi:hypothetical protein